MMRRPKELVIGCPLGVGTRAYLTAVEPLWPHTGVEESRVLAEYCWLEDPMLEERYESFALAHRSLRLAWCTCPVGTIQFDGSVLRCGFRRLWDRPSRRHHRLAHHSGVRCYGFLLQRCGDVLLEPHGYQPWGVSEPLTLLICALEA